MPEVPKRPGRIVRDAAMSRQVIGREAREGEFEIIGEKRGDWTTAEPMIPSTAKAQQIHSALKDALIKQLEADARTLGNLDEVAIHGKTGVSTLEDQGIAINPADR